MDTYDDFKTAIKNWLDDANLDAYIPDFISLAEQRIYRELQIDAMVTSLSSSISNGVLAVPADFLSFSYVNILSSGTAYPLEVRPAQWIMSQFPSRVSDSMPLYIGRDGGSFIFGPYPDTNYTVSGSYIKQLSALTTTNWFTSYAKDLLLFASLCEAEPFIMDDQRLLIWEGKYQNAKKEIKRQQNRTRIQGSPQRSVAI